MLVGFSLYPFLTGIGYSFTDMGWVNDDAEFVGMRNYELLFKGNVGIARYFKLAITQSLLWTGLVVAGQFIFAMITALVLNEKFPLRWLFRTAVIVPIAIPTVVLALTWQWMYDPLYGLINFYLLKFGIIDKAIIWVGSAQTEIWPLIVVGIWKGFPFMSLMLLSGLQAISTEMYEAARVDGSNAFQRFIYITLPQMRTTITIAIILHIIWWWNHFDIINIVAGSGGVFAYGAATLPILSWFESFRWNHLGRGAAISVISMLIILVLILWNARREMRSSVQEA
jgi:multiple sugar transport system permease protein